MNANDRRALLRNEDVRYSAEDIDLLARLAKVEGREFPGECICTSKGGLIWHEDGGYWTMGTGPDAVNPDGTKAGGWITPIWDPLHNDGDAMRLMRKYRVAVDTKISPDINRAICLAVLRHE